MVNKLTQSGRAYALRYILTQLIIIVCCCVTGYIVEGQNAVVSALSAGIVVLLPNIVFSVKAFQYAGARESKRVVESFNKGVKIKMLLTAILFALSFKYLDIIPAAFFITFSLTMVAPWLTAVVNKIYFNQQ